MGILLLTSWLGVHAYDLLNNIRKENIVPIVLNILKNNSQHPSRLSVKEMSFLWDYCPEVNMIFAVNYVLTGNMKDFSPWDNQNYFLRTWEKSISKYIKIRKDSIQTQSEHVDKYHPSLMVFQAASGPVVRPIDKLKIKIDQASDLSHLQKELDQFHVMEKRLEEVKDENKFKTLKNKSGILTIC